ncbi:putative phytoene desaturase [Mycobacterium kansasii]|uniref:Putative phytoene desaturase n=1 Tax=Mycobacterium kansasii TaxID=1768 RepID=A0A1V3X783_MYCKA|nr:putative phytoene desaturase [Mycobacterium kansasii]
MRDPSLLVTRPTASDPTLAPTGRDLFYLLAPAPNLAAGAVDWPTAGNAYAESIIDTVGDRLLPELRDSADVLDVVTPLDWARQGMAAGTPFALAHTFGQTGRSGRQTWFAASTMPCWRGRRPFPASVCRPRSSPGGLPPIASPAACADKHATLT